MTENEIVLIYTMFKNKFKGKTLGEVIPDIFEHKQKIDELKIINYELIENENWVFYYSKHRGSIRYSGRYDGEAKNIDLVELIGEVEDLI